MSSFKRQLGLWPAQRNQRLQLSDVLGSPRPVEHFAYFKRRVHADRAASELAASGFTVALGRRRLTTVFHASRDETLEDDSVARFLAEVVGVIEHNAGNYDGWGAPVVPGI
jgi:hypothetical protein